MNECEPRRSSLSRFDLDKLDQRNGLPAVVREGLVGVCHLVRVFAALDCSAQAVRCVEDLVGETLGHRLLATALGVGGEPAQRERVRTVRLDLDRNLVGGTTDTAALHLKGGANVVERLLQGNDGIRTILGGNRLECVVDDALGEGLLAVEQDLVDELADDGGAVYRVTDHGALGCWSLARHYFFSIFAP